ncbi:MAG: hypothetical protein PHN59_06045, partial [Candidatus Omnitrophica bacterium]|nr:hypothetical protein [Candidatus Omnitrophota bacterium]
MKKHSLADYLSYTGFKVIGFLIGLVPIDFSLFCGRLLGRLMYYLDVKHRRLARANIKKALGDKISPKELRQITKRFYLNFGQNIIEVFHIPFFNQRYIEKYIEIEGKQNLEQAFSTGKGVILLGVHAGSWELTN